jgi:exonuclease III
MTIKISLIRGNIEINPGPGPSIRNRLLDIITFNCNGLGNKQKLKRIITKANSITDKGGIVMLQETHITDESLLSFYTKANFQLNSFSTNSAGIITLYGKNFKTVFNYKDESGRQLYTVIEDDDHKFLVVNVYCPNDHRQCLNFMEQVYCKILEIRNDIPDCYVILAGDFNSCMNDNDLLNRNKLTAEKELTNFIALSNTMCELVDSFTAVNNGTGFTWNRGKCYSRLDYIYVSNELQSKISSSKVDWAFERSDHAALLTRLKIGT